MNKLITDNNISKLKILKCQKDLKDLEHSTLIKEVHRKSQIVVIKEN
jgi:hypothetical protein